MRQFNTDKMVKVVYEGHEYAFGKARKNEYGEYVIKVYVDGYYDEGKTIYENDRESAEACRDAEIARMTAEVKEVEEAKVEIKAEAQEVKTCTLTDKEQAVLEAIMSKSNFNYDSIELDKSWEEQKLEDGETFWAFADTKDYGCGMDKQAVRGIFGSLEKKGLIMIVKEDVTWIVIHEEEFENIKKAYGRA